MFVDEPIDPEPAMPSTIPAPDFEQVEAFADVVERMGTRQAALRLEYSEYDVRHREHDHNDAKNGGCDITHVLPPLCSPHATAK